MTRIAVGLMAAFVGLAAAASDGSHRERISSAEGFSFQPPGSASWLEKSGEHEITYVKKTDPAKVSFYVGAVEGKLRATLSTKDELVQFVRSKKEQWGPGGRYADISTSFEIEHANESCVKYRMSARDRGAASKGAEPFLSMQANGRFCLHPQDRTSAVDIYYSIRHIPTLDAKSLIEEGEAFLESLQFLAPK